MTQPEQKKAVDRTRRQGILTKTVTFILSLPVTVMVTLLISVLVEWGLIFHCDQASQAQTLCEWTDFFPHFHENHARHMLNQEAQYLNQHFKDSVMGAEPIRWVGAVLQWVDSQIFQPLGVNKLKSSSSVTKLDREWIYLIAAVYIVKVVLLRLCVLFFSLPAYGLFGLVGLVTGLVERDLRKFGAGRESTDRFELSVRLLAPSIVLCGILYLSWPNSINPAFIVVPFAALFGYAVHLSLSNYKKYL